MRLADIAVADVLLGKNWKLRSPFDDERHLTMLEWQADVATSFHDADWVVYAAVAVARGMLVKPLLVVKEVCDPEFGGDYLEYANGQWHEVGVTASPDAPPTAEYVANPLPSDPSFLDARERRHHAAQFARFSRYAEVS